MKTNKPVGGNSSPLFNQLISRLGKQKAEILPQLIDSNNPSNKEFIDFLANKKKVAPDVYEIRLEVNTFICEFEENVCCSSYLFFDKQEEANRFIQYCDESFIKTTDNCWLARIEDNSESAYSIYYFNLTGKDNQPAIFFQSVITNLPINEYDKF